MSNGGLPIEAEYDIDLRTVAASRYLKTAQLSKPAERAGAEAEAEQAVAALLRTQGLKEADAPIRIWLKQIPLGGGDSPGSIFEYRVRVTAP